LQDDEIFIRYKNDLSSQKKSSSKKEIIKRQSFVKNEIEECPFVVANRSPDSFLRISHTTEMFASHISKTHSQSNAVMSADKSESKQTRDGSVTKKVIRPSSISLN
jgi:hypothetical protein